MPLVWASLAVAILLPTIGAVVLFRRALALWRDLRRSGKALLDGLDVIGARLERMSAAAEGLGAVTGRAEPSVERLQVSLARLAVLRSAVGDVRDSVGRVTAVYPRK
jgi:hypothetical protein